MRQSCFVAIDASYAKSDPDHHRAMALDACTGYLDFLAKYLRDEHGDKIVGELRAKILFQIEIREEELGRRLTGHELFEIFWLASGRFDRSRRLAQRLYSKHRSS